MGQESPHVQEFSDQELAAMRQEVLRWIEEHGRPKDSAPLEHGPDEKQPKTARRSVRRSSPPAHTAVAPPAEGTVTAPKQRARLNPRLTGTLQTPAVELPATEVTVQPPKLVKPRPKPSHPTNSRARRRRRWIRMPLVTAAVGSLVIIFPLVGIYGLAWSGNFSRWLARILPLPAVYADGTVLTLDDFFHDVDVFTAVYRRSGKPTETTVVRDAVVARFADRTALLHLARRFGVTVGDEEIEGALQYLVSQAGSTQAFEQQIVLSFPRWSIDDFRSKLLAPYLLRQAVYGKLSGDEQAWQVAEQQAKKIHQLIRSGETTFAQAAVRFGQGGSGALDGDVGYRGATDLEPELYEQLVALDNGEVSEPVRSAHGYILMQPVERLGEPGQQQFRLRQLLIVPAANLEALLMGEQRLINVRRLVP